MNEEDKLTADVEAKTAILTSCSDAIGILETQVAELNGIIAKSTAVKEGRALSSLLGDPAAKAAILKARAEQSLAQEELGDITKYALPAAREAFAQAQVAAESAHQALARYHAGLLKRRRIGVTKEIDAVLMTALAPLIRELDDLGQSIANSDETPRGMFGPNTGAIDNIVGHRRLRAAIRAALGTRFEVIFPNAMHDERPGESLESSERRLWSLPEENADTKKAA